MPRCTSGMKRFLLIAAILGSLVLPEAALAWDGVDVTASSPERVTAGAVSVIDFRVTVGDHPLDLATVGPRLPGLNPIVVFSRGNQHVTVVAHRTLSPGVYRVRVVLPSRGGWTYTFRYTSLVRSGPKVVAGG